MFIIPVMRMKGVGDLTDLKEDSAVKAVSEKRFGSALKRAVREADQVAEDTQTMDMKLAPGQVDNLHTALIRAEKIVAAVEFTTQIITRAVDVYNQITGMQA